MMRLTLAPPQKRDDAPPPFTRSTALGLGGVVLAAFLSSIDQRIASAAGPDLLAGLGLGRDAGSWVSTAYSLGEIAVVPLTPWLAQLISPRRAIAAEIILFTVAAMCVPIVHGYHLLIAARFLQGFGEGGIVPLMLLSLLRLVPPRHRPEGFAVYALISTAVPLIAEPLAGVATDLFTWQALFWYSTSLAPVALFLVLAYMPFEKPKWEMAAGTNYFSMASLAAFSCLLVTGLSQGQRLDWFDSPFIVAMFAGAVFFLIVFVLDWWLSPLTLIDLSLFRHANFSVGLILVLVFNLGELAVTYLEPQTQSVLASLKPEQVGGFFLLLLIPQAVVTPLAVLLMRVLDARLLVASGLGLSCVGAYLCSYISAPWQAGDFLWPVMMQAAGWPMAFPALVFLTTSSLQPQDALSGGTIFNIVRTLAISAGPAIVTAIVTVRERVHSFYIVANFVPGSLAFTQRVSRTGEAALVAAAHVQAYVMAYADAFGWAAVVLLIGVGLVLVQRQAPIVR